jgi:hypothetical protein
MSDVNEFAMDEGARQANLESEQRALHATVERQAQEITRLRALATPLCVGKAIIQHLAADGAWQAEDGRALVAADELFHADPYERIAALETALAFYADAERWLFGASQILRDGGERARAALRGEPTGT